MCVDAAVNYLSNTPYEIRQGSLFVFEKLIDRTVEAWTLLEEHLWWGEQIGHRI